MVVHALMVTLRVNQRPAKHIFANNILNWSTVERMNQGRKRIQIWIPSAECNVLPTMLRSPHSVGSTWLYDIIFIPCDTSVSWDHPSIFPCDVMPYISPSFHSPLPCHSSYWSLDFPHQLSSESQTLSHEADAESRCWYCPYLCRILSALLPFWHFPQPDR